MVANPGMKTRLKLKHRKGRLKMVIKAMEKKKHMQVARTVIPLEEEETYSHRQVEQDP